MCPCNQAKRATPPQGGRWIRHCGLWQPDRKPHLQRRANSTVRHFPRNSIFSTSDITAHGLVHVPSALHSAAGFIFSAVKNVTVRHTAVCRHGPPGPTQTRSQTDAWVGVTRVRDEPRTICPHTLGQDPVTIISSAQPFQSLAKIKRNDTRPSGHTFLVVARGSQVRIRRIRESSSSKREPPNWSFAATFCFCFLPTPKRTCFSP